MNQVDINWKERFQDMHIDTKSTLKNIIRLDWTKNSRLEKEWFNRNIDKMIGDLIDEQSNYNKLVKRFKSEKTDKDLKLAKKIAEESEKNPSSLQGTMLNCKNKLQSLKSEFRKQEENAKRKIPIYFSPTIVDAHTGNLDKEINYLNPIITNCRKEIYKYQAKLEPVIKNVNLLNGEISNLDKEISNLEERKSEIDKNISNLDGDISRLNNQIANLKRESSNERSQESEGLDSISFRLSQKKEEQSKLTKKKSELIKEKFQKENIKSKKEKELNQLKIKQEGYQKIISNFEEELNRIDREVKSKNNQKVNDVYKDLKVFYDTNVKKIDSLINELENFLKKFIIDPARKGGIVNSNDVVNLIRSKGRVKRGICEIYNMILYLNLSEGYDSGYFKGFYTFLSTKKERLNQINCTIYDIRSSIKKSNSSLASIENMAQDFALGSENRVDSKSIRVNAEKFLKDVESISDKILKFQNEFKSRLEKITPPIVFKIEYANGKISKISEGIIKH